MLTIFRMLLRMVSVLCWVVTAIFTAVLCVLTFNPVRSRIPDMDDSPEDQW